MNMINNQFSSIEQVSNQYLKNNPVVVEENNNNLSFEEILQNTKRENDSQIIFSKHANERLESRKINLTDSQYERLNDGISKAREKSINESLIMMDNLSFIVNINNNTVITAMDNESTDNKVFTNIDGAVII